MKAILKIMMIMIMMISDGHGYFDHNSYKCISLTPNEILMYALTNFTEF